MDVYDAIVTRRSVPKVRTEAPTRAEIERLLDAAVRAPNHHLSQPWRFIVLTGSALDDLGAAWVAGTEREGKDSTGVAEKAHRAPIVIVVIERPRLTNPKVVELEEHHAVGAAMQNILLAAHASGLGAMLRTGPAATMPEVRAYLGLDDDEFIASFVYVGYPLPQAPERPMTRRTDAREITEWRG
ncbi:MAG: nitroreductase [Actinomycetota bacterium]|nr:nitroreductase [Actinomycetota bacterium]